MKTGRWNKKDSGRRLIAGLLLLSSFVTCGNGMPWEKTNNMGQPKTDREVWGKGTEGAAFLHGAGCMCMGCQGERGRDRSRQYEEEENYRRQNSNGASRWADKMSNQKVTQEQEKTPEQERQDLIASLQPSPYTGGANTPGYCKFCAAHLLGNQRVCSRCKTRKPDKYIRWQRSEMRKAQKLKELLRNQ